MTLTDTMKRCREAQPDDRADETQARLLALLQDMQALMGILPACRPHQPGALAVDLAEANFDNLPV